MTVSGDYIIVYYPSVKNILQTYLIKQYWVFWNLDDENLWDNLDLNYVKAKPPAPISNLFLRSKSKTEVSSKKEIKIEALESENNRIDSRHSFKSYNRDKSNSSFKNELKTIPDDDLELKKSQISQQMDNFGKKIDLVDVSATKIKSLKNSLLIENKSEQSLRNSVIRQDLIDKNNSPNNNKQNIGD